MFFLSKKKKKNSQYILISWLIKSLFGLGYFVFSRGAMIQKKEKKDKDCNGANGHVRENW